VISSSGRGSEDGLEQFAQALEGSAGSLGQATYGLDLRDSWSEGNGYVANFFLITAEGSYRYAATADQVEVTDTLWGGLSYTFTGWYELVARPGGSEVMPQGGTFSATIEFSPSQQRIVGSTYQLGS
jgi:hypothetical protein